MLSCKKCSNAIKSLLTLSYIRMLITGGVIPEASHNTRYGTRSVVKTAVRNVACNLTK